MSDHREERSVSRRSFLRGLAAGTVAGGVLGVGAEEASAQGSKYKFDRRVLGRTGFKITPINIGTVPAPSPQVVSYAIDVGTNYIDTAACYAGGNAETNIGVVMKNRRKEVVLATKWHTRKGVSKDELLQSLRGSLQRLQTDHVDIIQVHGVGDLDQVNCPGLFEAFQEAKNRGWVRFLGASCHNSGAGMQAMKWAVNSGKFDMILMKYNFVEMADLKGLIDLAKQKNVGVVAMKTLGGARQADLKGFTKEERDQFPRAAMRWTMSNPAVSCLVIGMKSLQDVDLYTGALGQPLTAEDVHVLEKYASLVQDTHCRWCNECLPCPEGIAIPEVLRYSMYYRNYGLERHGMASYAALGEDKWANRCTGCGLCEQRCPYNISIIDQLKESHTMLA